MIVYQLNDFLKYDFGMTVDLAHLSADQYNLAHTSVGELAATTGLFCGPGCQIKWPKYESFINLLRYLEM